MRPDFDALGARLSEVVRGTVERSCPLARFTTYRLGGPAAIYVEPADIDDLVALGSLLGEEAAGGDVPVLVVGRGSNLVISDEGWPGVAVRLRGGFSALRADPDDHTVLDVGAAKPLPLAANWSARRGLAGLEWGVGVPGSVGGAVCMNAGAHGRDMAATIVAASVFDVDKVELTRRDAAALDLDYRESNLRRHEIVTEARLRLTPADRTTIKARMDAYRRHRAATQPGALQNAGSTFKNPDGDSAGRLVEAAGLKGFRVGAASVSTLHANFFMAEDGATAQDVHDLVFEVRGRVEDFCGLRLEPEVGFVGRFAPSPSGVESR